MEWQIALLILIGTLLILFFSGLPVAFCFLFITMVGAVWLWGGGSGLRLLTLNIRSSVSSFSLLPIPMFILMGEVMFRSKLGEGLIGAVDKWLGHLPGRLSLLAVGAGTLLSTLSGVTIATTAILGSTLVPQMEKRGYKKPMTLGPILGSGGLAMMIPPSSLAVLLASIGEISVGQILIAIIFPGLLMAVFYATYIIVRSKLQPSLAPPYESPVIPLSEKLMAIVQHVLPLGFIVFLVIGLIFVGIATPSEAAATGAVGTFILALAHRQVSREMIKKVFLGTIRTTVMLFMIIAAAVTFGQILAFSGASQGLVAFTVGLPVPPIFIIVAMQLLLLFMGFFMAPGSIIMITIPLFMPVVQALGFHPVWFGTIMLLNIEMSMTTPPFGLGLFVMKSVAPAGTTIADCYKAGLPFLACDAVVMALILVFPALALWLPKMMG